MEKTNGKVLVGILALKYPVIDQALEAVAKKGRARYDETADQALAKLGAK